MSNHPLHPPRARTRLWHEITKGARQDQLRLQQCGECGRVQYPPREVCQNCLSTTLDWHDNDGLGRVISEADLHITLDPWFRDRLPLHVALVELNSGPVLYAFAPTEFEHGTPVRVRAVIDDSGEAVLHIEETKTDAD
ncbi:Zn-ribbon domain-containing OB-fold protein [Govanella unica]|uniref:Zinc ribbon domain-containing protein n=1 Tax=Govanella unica TaxID=2975056 RepID=A0A9X3Z6V3_9PROT|nr:zinc ribbon domain-containing protein [Govania unica]MDA5193502.1 zinc ribbon domain-containing protein [Govania unica]